MPVERSLPLRRLAVLWLTQLLLVPRSASGFLGRLQRYPFPTHTGIETHPMREQRQQTSKLFATPATTTTTTPSRNMFHDYDGPIVLIGCSSSSSPNDGELRKLAESLTEVLNGSRKIVPLTSDSPLKSQEYAWPDILLADLTLLGETEIETVARSLYEESGYLSIYVNVDSGSLTDAHAKTKDSLDESVFCKYSDYEICIRDELATGTADSGNWQHIEWELTRILARARLIPAIPGDTDRSVNTAHLTMGQHAFFLSLSFPEINEAAPYVQEMCKDVDAMEYRTDLLDCRDSRFDLLYGMQQLRKYCRPHAIRVAAVPFGGTVLEDVVPIVYTVRTQNQAGTYPDDESGISKMFKLLDWGLRAGVEVLDIESAWDAEKTGALLDKAEKRYSSQILGSHHVVGKEIDREEAVALFEQCAMNGRAHGAKVVLSIDSEAKDGMAYEAALISTELAASAGSPVIPNISLILGEVGQFSRIINFPFTPVTHESLPFTAAPGQMTSSEIMATRLLTQIFSPMKYAILGHNIAYSVSPQMHGAAFEATKLPHQYVRADVATVEEFIESDFFKSDDFGGASVTIPHKQSIMPYVDELSEAAQMIGSANTVIAKSEFVDDEFKRVIYGDNTDWKGIFNPLNRKLGGNVDSEKDAALILGAGGTARAAAYVAKKLGLKLIYYNRTPSKAEELVETFGGTLAASLDQYGEGSLGDLLGRKGEVFSLAVVISTLPAASEFILPNWLLADDKSTPVVFDVNYKPYSTALLRQAEKAGCSVVRGSEMLWEQGVGQFELWTGRTAPYSVMKQVVLENCQETPSGPDADAQEYFTATANSGAFE